MAGFAPEVLAKLASLGLVAPMGIGKKFYVNGGADGLTVGDNGDAGESIAAAFLTIAYALTQCVAGRNDYIYCWNTRNQDTAPIVVAVANVHIIGLRKPGISPGNEMEPADDNPMFQAPIIDGGCKGVEIAGFCIGGGGTNGCIDLLGGQYDWWIHHCTFGHEWVPAAQDGIRLTGGSHIQGLLIEDNVFLGGNGPKGRITQYGIVAIEHLYQSMIRRNKILRCPTGGITLGADCIEVIVDENKISCGSDAVAMAIDLAATCSGCQISSNEAQFGDAAMTNNPYRDQAAADENDWMCNQVGSVMKYPEEAM